MASHAMLTALPPRPSLLAHRALHLRKRLVPMAALFGKHTQAVMLLHVRGIAIVKIHAHLHVRSTTCPQRAQSTCSPLAFKRQNSFT